MRIGALLGWGVGIYAVVYLAWSAFIIHQLDGISVRLFVLGVMVATTIVAGRSLRGTTWHDILPYSFSWALMAIVLDAIIVVPSGGIAIYYDWGAWFGYLIVVTVPLLTPYLKMNPHIEELEHKLLGV